MKQAARFGVSIGSLLLLIALFFSWRIFLVRLRTPRCCTFSLDAAFSEKLKEEIISYAETLDLRLASDPAAYGALFQDHFPLISGIKTTLLASGTLAVLIEGGRPLCIINDDKALADCGIIAPVNSFALPALTHCPRLWALDEHLVTWSCDSLACLLHRFSSTLLDSYEIWLSSFPEVLLAHKIYPKLSLFARQDIFDAEELENRGQKVIAMLEKRSALTTTKQKQWLADMRFHNMIVLVAK